MNNGRYGSLINIWLDWIDYRHSACNIIIRQWNRKWCQLCTLHQPHKDLIKICVWAHGTLITAHVDNNCDVTTAWLRPLNSKAPMVTPHNHWLPFNRSVNSLNSVTDFIIVADETMSTKMNVQLRKQFNTGLISF